MAIRMIVSDLDGTILDASYQMSEKTKAAIREATARGVRVLLATGRMFASAVRYAKELALDTPVISHNGGVVQEMDGTLLHADFLAAETAARVLRYVFARGWYVQLYRLDGLFFAADTEKARFYRTASAVSGEVVGEDGLLARTEGVPKLLVVADAPAHTAAILAEIAAAFPGEIDVMQSTATYIEIVPTGVSKASAMLKVAAGYGISAEEIMALGDSGNDVAMLRAAGLGVAMGNAAPEVKRAADVVTTSVAEDGAALAVRRYVLGRGDDAAR